MTLNGRIQTKNLPIVLLSKLPPRQWGLPAIGSWVEQPLRLSICIEFESQAFHPVIEKQIKRLGSYPSIMFQSKYWYITNQP